MRGLAGWTKRFLAMGWGCFIAFAFVAVPSMRAAELPTIYIAGDSTAANGAEGARGWGRHFGKFFDAEQVRVENRARGGRSSRTFVTEGLWDDLCSGLRPGDVVVIQFGHNDGGSINDARRARGSLPGLGDESQDIVNQQTGKPETVHTFGWYVRKMIADVRAKEAEPILMSLTVRNIWREGKVERGSGRYSQWLRELSESEKTPFVDLTNLVADEYERRGPDAVAQLFPKDHTHTSDVGAELNARLAMEGFLGLREEIWAPWLSDEGRAVQRCAPQYVGMASVRRGAGEAERRFLNTPSPADPSLPTLWLIGDSTVRTGRGRGEGGQYGWGDPLQNYFDLTKINVVNRAMGGTGARTFRTGGLWEPVLEQIKPGDFVVVQFGHNDNGPRGALRGTGSDTEQRQTGDGGTEVVESFGAYLGRFVDEIRAKEATPVICSLIPRNLWEGDTIQRSDNGHAAWARQTADAKSVFFIDLHELIAQRYDAMGKADVAEMFADGRVHTSYAGAALNATCVLEGLRQLPGDALAKYLVDSPTAGR
ncbi:MAG: rhamnogalacturonan acetylesterase [Planctomycetales bacterium]|nr:rhamnogalacturonan acetylesterase [Planctomycetales bacterium]